MRIIGPVNFVLLLLSISMSAGCDTVRQSARGESYGVTITGVQHLGNDFSIRDFYVDDYSGGNVGRGGGGGSYACCVMMPGKWHNGLTVVVKWSVSNWKNSDYDAIAREDYSSIKLEESYIAIVPIEQYSELGNLYVHFFANGKVRAVSSMYRIFREGYPISRDASEEQKATQGISVTSINNKNRVFSTKGK